MQTKPTSQDNKIEDGWSSSGKKITNEKWK